MSLIKEMQTYDVIIEDDLLAFIYITKSYLHTWKEEDSLA